MANSATIQYIVDIKKHNNADTLELYTVLGWQVVDKIGSYEVGDKIIFIEIDSIVPDIPEFEFLKKVNMRVKTVRLRGELSQGLIMPLSLLDGKIDSNIELTEGLDISEVLGITHYEKPIPVHMGGIIKGNFPRYVRKTDEIMIQKYPALITEMQGKRFYSTIKIDGTSGSFIHKDIDFDICSRTLSIKEDENNIYWKMFYKYGLKEKLEELGNVAIQGELAGPGIQKNRLGLKEVKMFVFDIYYIDKREYCGYYELKEICEKYGLDMVELEEIGIFNYNLEQLVEKSRGLYKETNTEREGLVYRCVETIYSEILKNRLSFKVMNIDYKE